MIYIVYIHGVYIYMCYIYGVSMRYAYILCIYGGYI